MDAGDSTIQIGGDEPSSGELSDLTPAEDHLDRAAPHAKDIEAQAAPAQDVDSQCSSGRGRAVSGSMAAEMPSSSSPGPGHVSPEVDTVMAGNVAAAVPAALSAAGFKARLKCMLMPGGYGPVASGMPKVVGEATIAACIAALDAAEMLYAANGWAGVGTQHTLGYRVDTYEATAYVLGDAFLGHVMPKEDARAVGQKARKCRDAEGRAKAEEKLAKKAAQRAGSDPEAAAASARASIMQQSARLPLPSVQKCVADRRRPQTVETDGAPAARRRKSSLASPATASESKLHASHFLPSESPDNFKGYDSDDSERGLNVDEASLGVSDNYWCTFEPNCHAMRYVYKLGFDQGCTAVLAAMHRLGYGYHHVRGKCADCGKLVLARHADPGEEHVPLPVYTCNCGVGCASGSYVSDM